MLVAAAIRLAALRPGSMTVMMTMNSTMTSSTMTTTNMSATVQPAEPSARQQRSSRSEQNRTKSTPKSRASAASKTLPLFDLDGDGDDDQEGENLQEPDLQESELQGDGRDGNPDAFFRMDGGLNPMEISDDVDSSGSSSTALASHHVQGF